MPRAKVKATPMTLFCRGEIRSDRVDIPVSRGRLSRLLAGSLDLKMQHQAPPSAPDDLLGLTVPVGLKRVGREMRMLVENADDVKSFRRAAAWKSDPIASTSRSLEAA